MYTIPLLPGPLLNIHDKVEPAFGLLYHSTLYGINLISSPLKYTNSKPLSYQLRSLSTVVFSLLCSWEDAQGLDCNSFPLCLSYLVFSCSVFPSIPPLTSEHEAYLETLAVQKFLIGYWYNWKAEQYW